MVYFYYGENDFEITQKVAGIFGAFTLKYGEMSTVRLDGNEISARDLVGQMVNIDMFAPNKLLIVKNIGKNTENWEALVANIGRVPESTSLVVVENHPDGRTKTFKDLKKLADKEEKFIALKSWEVEKWAKTELQKNEMELRSGLTELVAYCNADQWRIHHEITKLASVSRVLTRELVEKYVEPDLSANVFNLLEMAVNKNPKLDDEIAKLKINTEPYMVFGAVSSQLVNIAIAKQGGTAKEFGVNPWAFKSAEEIALKITDEKLQKILQKASEIDAKLKSTGQDPWILVEVFLKTIF